MSVTIASDPVAEADTWKTLAGAKGLQIHAVELNRLQHAAVENGDDFGEDIDQVMQNIAELIVDVGLLEIDFSGLPQAVERLLDVVVDVEDLVARVHCVLALHEEQIKLAVVLEHGRALGFGRVGGQHRFDHHFAQSLHDLLLRETGLFELF